MASRHAAMIGLIVVPSSAIKGKPRFRALVQRIPREPRPWWTAEALIGKGGIRADRATGRIVRRARDGWEIRIFTDRQRSRFFSPDA